jgi:hypothetical protein
MSETEKPRWFRAGSVLFADGFPELAKQWHPTKNERRPDNVTTFSDLQVHWVGPCGHEWKAMVKSRSRGRGCPACVGKAVVVGFNDLASQFPEVAAEWHPTKNGDRLADETLARTIRKIWWLGACGHEWDAVAVSRTERKTGCPVCAGNKVLAGFNDLHSAHPGISAQWHPSKNGNRRPDQVTAMSGTRAWWLAACDHEWQASICNRAGLGSGCPICAGLLVLSGFNDLKTRFPSIALEWHPTKNHETTADATASGSHKKAWWLGFCGHEWNAVISRRTGPTKSGCPACSGRVVLLGFNDLLSQRPKIAREWHPTRNGELTPADVTYGSGVKAWWLGPCGHEYRAHVNNRSSRSTGCAKCSNQHSRIEKSVFLALSPHLVDPKHGARIPLDWRSHSSATLDISGLFAARKVALEYDGSFFHADPATVLRDTAKTRALLDDGWLVVRIRENTLPHLDLTNPNLLQISHKYRAARDDVQLTRVAPTVAQVVDWLLLVTRPPRPLKRHRTVTETH